MTSGAKIRNLILFCALAAPCVPVEAAEPLGRLFFTPDQRASLDTARSKKTRVNLATESPDEKAPPAQAPLPEVVTYGGIVRRSDGKATIWLNDRAVHDKDARSGAVVVGRVRPDGSVTVQSPQSGRSVDLKVGQRAELLSGKVEEGYSSRGATATKPEAKSEAKPETKPAPKAGADASAKEERDREERERRRDVEDAVRALREAAESAKPPPAAGPVPPSQAPVR